MQPIRRQQFLWVIYPKLNTDHYHNLLQIFHLASKTENEEFMYKILTQYPFSACNLSKVWLQNRNVPAPQWKYFGVSSWEHITTENALLVSFGYNCLKFQADKDDEATFRAQLCPFCQQNMIWYTGLPLTDTCLICILGFRNMEYSTIITLMYYLQYCCWYTKNYPDFLCDLLWHRRKMTY